MFSALCVCHSVYRRWWGVYTGSWTKSSLTLSVPALPPLLYRGPHPDMFKLVQLGPHHTGNLCPLPPTKHVQTCSLCSSYICRHSGCWHSTEVPSCFFCAFVNQLLQKNIFIEYIYVLKVFNIKKTLILMIFWTKLCKNHETGIVSFLLK